MMMHICYMKGKKQINQDNDSVTCISGIQNMVIHCEDGTSSLYLDADTLRKVMIYLLAEKVSYEVDF